MRPNLFRPNKTTTHAQQTSTAVADPKTFVRPASATGFWLSCLTNGCYLTVDGTVPTAGNGLPVPANAPQFFPLTLDADPQGTSQAAGNSVMNVLWVN